MKKLLLLIIPILALFSFAAYASPDQSVIRGLEAYHGAESTPVLAGVITAYFTLETNLEKQMNFGKALEEVKQGKAMRLPQWSEDVLIKAQFPDENSKMTAPYLYVESRYGLVPWKETMIELFSEAWEVVLSGDIAESERQTG